VGVILKITDGPKIAKSPDRQVAALYFAGYSTSMCFSWENRTAGYLQSFRQLQYAALSPQFMVGLRELRAMLQDPASRDVFTVHRPSPWPFVGAMIAATALITTLVVAFSS